MIIFYHVACIYITYYLNLYSGLDACSVLLRFPSWFLFYEYFIYLNAVISMSAELRIPAILYSYWSKKERKKSIVLRGRGLEKSRRATT